MEKCLPADKLANHAIEEYRLFVGNHLDILSSFDDCTFDLTITSPPYDKQREYKGYDFKFEPLAKELYRVTVKGGVLVWVVNDSVNNGCESLTSFKQAIFFVEQCGFNLHDTMIYAKNNYVPLTHNRYEQQFEYMFVFAKGRPKTFNPIMIPCKYAGEEHKKDHTVINATAQEKMSAMRKGRFRRPDEIRKVTQEKYKPNIWFYSTGLHHTTEDKNAFNHPAVLPEQLAYDHIISWSNKGDLVLDPMVGSGTVGKMCGQLERRFVGIDICKEYVEDIARPRIDKAYRIRQLKLFEGS